MKIETERLYIEELSENNVKLFLDYIIKNKSFLQDSEPERSSEYYELVYQMQSLENSLNKINLVILKRGSEKVIGAISFSNIIYGAFQSCFLSYKLDKDELNKGYITEALKKTIDYIFKEIKLHRIEANIMPENKSSLKVVEKLGFINEGLARKYLKINGEWRDHIHMVLLNE